MDDFSFESSSKSLKLPIEVLMKEIKNGFREELELIYRDKILIAIFGNY